MFRRARLVFALLAVFCLLSSAPVYAGEGGEPVVVPEQPGTGMPRSTITGVDAVFAQEYGKTSIFLRICGDGGAIQLRSEGVGKFITEVFNRTQKANGCSPSTTFRWRMIYNADPGPDVYRIYATMNDTFLSEGAFMQRAMRRECRVTGYGVGTCSDWVTPSVPNMSIDTPGNGQQVQGVINIGGWAIDAGATNGSGVSDVHVRVDGNFIGVASYGASRTDVGGAYGESRFNNSGYNIAFDTRSISNAGHTIQVTYRSSITGVWHGGERYFTVNNAPISTVGDLNGRVTDAASGSPLSGVRVTLGSRISITGADGGYGFSNVPAGATTVVFAKDDYASQQVALTVFAAASVNRDVALTSQRNGFTLPLNQVVGYRNQDNLVSNINAYMDIEPRVGFVHDARHLPGTFVPINGRRYTAPWPGSEWRLGIAYMGHRGTDFNGTNNVTGVIAAAPGYVVSYRNIDPDNNRSLPGNNVVMRHPNIKGRDVCVLYYHLKAYTIPDNIKQAAGRNVLIPRGTLLGKIGNSGNSDGSHLHFEVQDCGTRRAIDPFSAGLWASGAVSITAQRDVPMTEAITPPTVVFTPTLTVVRPNDEITFDASTSVDDGAIIQYAWDMDDGTQLEGMTTAHRFSTPGSYYVTLRAMDNNGDAALSAPKLIVVSADAGTPGLDVTPPQGSAAFVASYTAATTTTLALVLDGESASTTQVRYSSDGAIYGDWEAFVPARIVSLPSTEGLSTIFVQFRDAAGNTSLPIAASIVIDRTTPTLLLSEPITDTLAPYQAAFAWRIDDVGISGHEQLQVECKLVGVDADWRVPSDSLAITYSGLLTGEYTFRVRVTDQAGNVQTVEKTALVAPPPGHVYLPLVQQ